MTVKKKGRNYKHAIIQWKKQTIRCAIGISCFLQLLSRRYYYTHTPQKATAGVALVILVLLALIFALRPKKTEEDLIAEQDERNQYIELKCAAKAFRVALHASFMTIIAGMIAFGLTREYAFIWLVMGGILPYGASRIAYIVSAFRYDK
ncbi:MAG: hypothetical protein ACLSCQ_08935 [Evtepia gabavorous]